MKESQKKGEESKGNQKEIKESHKKVKEIKGNQ
jgi:hypothetical protein